MKDLLITGATGGLGRATVREALARGWSVTAIHGTNQAAANDLRAEHPRAGTRLELVAVDFADTRTVSETARTLAARHPWEAMLHLAAAPLELSPTIKQSPESFERQWRVAVASAIAITQVILPTMRHRPKGALIYCLSSVTLDAPPKGMAAYTSAKYALWGYARTLAAECDGTGVVVTCVSPGPMDTGLLRLLPEVAKSRMRDHAGTGQFLDPSAVALMMMGLVENPDPSDNGLNIPVLLT